MKLLIAIPVYNESRYLQRVLGEVLSIHSDVLVVDDGSNDNTGPMLAQRRDIHLLRHERNLGYGQSLIDAFAYADRHGYDWVITMDCDEQHEPSRIADFLRAIESNQWDLISGSRYLQPSKEDDLPPGDRRTINATITATVNQTLGLDLTDAFCGFKAHRVSAMRRIELTEAGYAFPMQLWPAVVRAGFRITEIPVRLIYKDLSRTFGGVLDNADARLRHYLDVFRAELEKPDPAPVNAATDTVGQTETSADSFTGCPCCCA